MNRLSVTSTWCSSDCVGRIDRSDRVQRLPFGLFEWLERIPVQHPDNLARSPHHMSRTPSANLLAADQPPSRPVLASVCCERVAHANPAPDARWAMFDRYGTLVDWNARIQAELARWFGAEHAPRLLMRDHELEPRVRSDDPRARYRDVMAAVLAELASDVGRELAPEDEAAPGRSLPAWPVVPEVPGQLEELRRGGWQLVILSNRERDLIDASSRAIGVAFSGGVVASEVGSYKPALAYWRAFCDTTRADRDRQVQVAQRHFDDTVPAYESVSAPSGSTGLTSGRSRPPPASGPIFTGSRTCSTSSCPRRIGAGFATMLKLGLPWSRSHWPTASTRRSSAASCSSPPASTRGRRRFRSPWPRGSSRSCSASPSLSGSET
jgi:HAD superfamily hydrolase (TIGR01493 family)